MFALVPKAPISLFQAVFLKKNLILCLFSNKLVIMSKKTSGTQMYSNGHYVRIIRSRDRSNISQYLMIV